MKKRKSNSGTLVRDDGKTTPRSQTLEHGASNVDPNQLLPSAPVDEEMIEEDDSTEQVDQDGDTESTESDEDTRVTTRKGRGDNKLPPPPEYVDDKPILYIRGVESFGGCKSISQRIASILKKNTRDAYNTYRGFEEPLKQRCFTDFLEYYRFTNYEVIPEARLVFDAIAATRYSDALAKLRKDAKVKFGEDMSTWKNWDKPFMSKQSWNDLVDYWNTEGWKKRALVAQQNRYASGETVHHTGGSISIQAHKDLLEAELGREATVGEVFRKTHINKSGNYANGKSKRVIETYDKLVKEKTGGDSSTQHELHSEEWLKVCGGPSKGRIYGLGDAVDSRKILPKPLRCKSFPTEASTSTFSLPVSALCDDPRLQAYLAEEIRKAVNESVEKTLETISEKFYLTPRSPPRCYTPPPQSNTTDQSVSETETETETETRESLSERSTTRRSRVRKVKKSTKNPVVQQPDGDIQSTTSNSVTQNKTSSVKRMKRMKQED